MSVTQSLFRHTNGALSAHPLCDRQTPKYYCSNLFPFQGRCPVPCTAEACRSCHALMLQLAEIGHYASREMVINVWGSGTRGSIGTALPSSSRAALEMRLAGRHPAWPQGHRVPGVPRTGPRGCTVTVGPELVSGNWKWDAHTEHMAVRRAAGLRLS